MSKLTQNYEQLAVILGMRLDSMRNIIYGHRNGYGMMIKSIDNNHPYMLEVRLSANSQMGVIGKEDSKQFVKNTPKVLSLQQEGNMIKMTLKSVSKQEKLCNDLLTAVDSLISYLNGRGYVPCCQFCGQQMETVSFNVGGNLMHLCPECAGRLRADQSMAGKREEQKKENIVTGIVGAFLGAVIGAVCIIMFSQLGRVAVVSGIIMAACTLKGYELLGGKLTKKGIVIGIIMMLAMTYIGDRMDWAILIAREWETDFFTGFRYVPVLLEEGYIEGNVYWYNLILLYVFTVGGAVPTVYSSLKSRKEERQFEQIGMTNLQ